MPIRKRRADTSADRRLADDSKRRRRRSVLPFVAFVVTLALPTVLAISRSGELNRLEAKNRVEALDDLNERVSELMALVKGEADRVTELVLAIQSFASLQADAGVAASGYLQASGAPSRFPSLMAAAFVDGATGELTLWEPPSSSTPDLTRTIDEIELVDQMMGLEPTDSRAELFHFHSDDGDTYGIVFPISQPQTSARATTAALLVTDAWIQPIAVGGRRDLSVHVHPLEGDALLQQPQSATIRADGSMSASGTVEVFGASFVLDVEVPNGFFEPESRAPVYLILAVGLCLALGVFTALRYALGSRSVAIQRARNASAEHAAIDARFRASFELSPIGIAELDAQGRIVSLNEAMAQQIGTKLPNALGRNLSDLVHEDDRPAHQVRIRSVLEGSSESAQGEHRYAHGDAEIWVSESISAVESGDESRRSLLVQSQDITSQRRAAWDLAQQALHDELTGLPNRALFINRLKHALHRAERSGEQVAVMFIDVDRFKVINDSLGHEVGDDLLVQFARRLTTATRTGDTVARFGGDEFVVLCESVQGESEALAIAQRIERSIAEPFVLAGAQTFASASIGINLSGPEDASADGLLRDADAAMYRAKEAGRARTEMFDRSMRNSMVARMEIESQLRQALRNNELALHYQAIVNPFTHQLAGFEALVRWNHPKQGLLGPSAFLPVAEDAGMIDRIDSFALHNSCRQLAQWIERFPETRNIYVSTNWSARHLGRFVQQVGQVLEATRVPPHQLVIEVTEGFLLEDSEASLVALAQLKSLGVRVAIDDFGTGYSSLAYLTRFDVDFLKIDQSFVQKLPEDTASAAVIGAIADMARRLGISLVAEGVETDEQIQMLANLGAPRMQGYRFAKPRPAQDIDLQLEQMATRRRGKPAPAVLS